jgi:hypothetical protein
MKLKRALSVLSAAAILAGLCACGSVQEKAKSVDDMFIEQTQVTDQPMEIDEEAVPIGAAAAVSTVLTPKASGTVVKGNSDVSIDASNTGDGYVMVKFLRSTTKRLKLLVTVPDGTTYTYNLPASGSYQTFPLSGGDGTYKLGVYENISGTSYSTVYTVSLSVKLTDQFSPFLLPNQYVNYTSSSQVVKKAAELTAGCKTDIDSIKAVYQYVVKNFTYDKELAATVKSGYLPNIDSVLAKKKGICFDYAAVMAAMLRSQGIPTKLVVGYTGKTYHAWINTYTKESGWVEGSIYFDGTTWKLMDPTFASTGKSSSTIMKYINNSDNYTAKYLY